MQLIHKIYTHVRVHGLIGMARAIKQRAFPKPCSVYRSQKNRFSGKVALEVGDATPIFMPGGGFPVYQELSAVDRLLANLETEWTANAPKHPARNRLIGCGTECELIADNEYDVVLTSHVLEHLANPLKALRAWHRILKSGGALVLVVPHHAFTFDRKRPISTFAHFLSDYDKNMPESDRTHFEEFIRCFDDGMTFPETYSKSELVKLATRNAKTGWIHHHTFDEILVALSCEWAGLRVEDICIHPPFHIVCVATKP